MLTQLILYTALIKKIILSVPAQGVMKIPFSIGTGLQWLLWLLVTQAERKLKASIILSGAAEEFMEQNKKGLWSKVGK